MNRIIVFITAALMVDAGVAANYFAPLKRLGSKIGRGSYSSVRQSPDILGSLRSKIGHSAPSHSIRHPGVAGVERSTDVWDLLRLGSVDEAEIKRRMAEGSLDIHAKNKADSTLLMFSAARRLPWLTKHLIESGADITARDRFGTDALMAAANSGDIESARMILATPEGKSLIDARGSRGFTAIFFPASQGNPEMTQLLVDAGFSVNVRSDEYGSTPYIVAKAGDTEGHRKVQKILLGAGANQHDELIQYVGQDNLRPPKGD